MNTSGINFSARKWSLSLAVFATVVAISPWPPTFASANKSSVVIFIHGVNASPEKASPKYAYRLLEKSSFYKDLSKKCHIIQFFWGPEPTLKASDTVGDRANSVFGMSDQAFVAVCKFKELVARTRESVGPDVPITVFSYSQGTAISCCALQEGLKVDNWILLGSPLDKEELGKAAMNTRFADAAKNVSGKVINFYSKSDFVVMIKGGIGRFGLPKTIKGIPGSFKNRRLANIYNIEIEGVSHSATDGIFTGNASWLDFLWTSEPPRYKWHGPLSAVSFLELIAPDKTKTTSSSQIELVCKFASTSANQDDWKNSFGDANRNEFKTTFTLTPELQNGIYFDDKDVAEYEVHCQSGSCEVQVESAVWDKWNQRTEWKKLKAGQSWKGKYRVNKTRGFLKLDATIHLKVRSTSKQISKVKCKLIGIDE